MPLIEIKADEIETGVAVPFNIYDKNNRVLLEKGKYILTEKQRLEWLSKRIYKLDNQIKDLENDYFEAEDIKKKDKLDIYDMRMRIGDKIQIEVLNMHTKYIVKLIGFLEDKSVLVTQPYEYGKKVEVNEGDEIVVRAFSNQNIFIFNSSIKRINKTPFEYLHLNYPVEIFGNAIRNAPRVKVHIISSVSIPIGIENKQAAVISNLSIDGCFLKTKHQLSDINDKIDISFKLNLHGEEVILTCSGVIKKIDFDENDKKHQVGHGIKFDKLSSNNKIFLQSYIYKIMIEDPNASV